MNRFKNILVKVSDYVAIENDMALQRGAELAKENNAKLTLMDVIEVPEGMLNNYKGMISPAEITSLMVQQKIEALQLVADKLVEKGIRATVVVKSGKDFIEIIKYIILKKIDLLIKIANPDQHSFDSSEFHLMRKCPQPVWLIKPEQNPKNTKVVASIDLSLEKTEEGKALNRLILDLACSVNEGNNTQVSMLSCWSFYGENSLRYGAFTRISDEELERLLAAEKSAYESHQAKLLNAYAETHADTNITPVLLKGAAADLIPQYVNQESADIVVMGTVGRTGVKGLLIGNTSETILQQINSSVITTKPDGFSSPITP